MQTTEFIASLLTAASVAFTVRQNIWCWPTGLAAVVLYAVVFYDVMLYSDMLLQIAFVGLQLYGWHAWLRGGPDRSPLAVTRIRPAQAARWCAICILATAIQGTIMHRYFGAAFPFVDAFAAVASLIAQWLMARKILESWLIWILVDVVSIGLYLGKSLYWTTGLYVVFLGMATRGWCEWRNAWRNQARDSSWENSSPPMPGMNT